MLSRVADNLYWMSRYLERAEHTARILQVQINIELEQGLDESDRRSRRLLRALGIRHKATDDARELAQSLVADISNHASIVSSIMSARENARQVREQISSEMWEQLNGLFHQVKIAETENNWRERPLDFLDALMRGSHLFQGITDSTMTHAEGWQFISVGRYLERASLLSSLVSEHFRDFGTEPESQEAGEHFEWIGLLKCCTAFEAYCKVYTADPRHDRIADFLILHPGFPHSIRFAVDAVETSLKSIGADVGRKVSRLDRIAGKLRATLSFGQIDEILESGVQEYLRGVLDQCNALHGAIHQIYITYPVTTALQA